MRRRVLFVALPAALLAGRAQATPTRLELAGYSSQTLCGTAAQLFADKAAALFPDAFQIEVAEQPPTMPFAAIGQGLGAGVLLCAGVRRGRARPRPVRRADACRDLRRGRGAAARRAAVTTPPRWRGTARSCSRSSRGGRRRCGAPSASARPADLRGARFALDETPYAGDGWAELFARLGTERSAYGEAELMLSGGYTSSETLAREFACVTEIFFAQQLTFLTANREVFESLTEAQREALLAIGRATEAQLWREIRPFVRRDQQEVASRGVLVSAEPPADLVTALREAAEPDVRRWAAAMGAEGATLLADYRRAIGF